MFAKQKEINNSGTQMVHMTQFYTYDFSATLDFKYVATMDISSCVVIIIKNINNKKCQQFGMAHVNLANVFLSASGKENLQEFLNQFKAIGGDLTTASVQLFGGLANDPNNVRVRIKQILQEIVPNINIKEPVGYTNDIGNLMSIACDINGTYIRKITIENGKITKRDFNSNEAENLLSDENINNIIFNDLIIRNIVYKKTSEFQQQINKLFQSGLSKNDPKYQQEEQNIAKNYCRMEANGINVIQQQNKI